MRLSPLLETFKIRDKAGKVIPFSPNQFQAQIIAQVESDLNEGRPSRIIVLKSRQVGVSTLSELLLLSACITFPNTNATVAAHTAKSAGILFGIPNLAYQKWPFRTSYPLKYETRKEMAFRSTNSNIWVETARQSDAGRGRTLSHLHTSEVAFWDAPAETMVAYNQAVPQLPGTMVVIESTANGVGNYFHEQWLQAVSGGSDYSAFFFPWYEHYESLPCSGRGCTDGSCERCEMSAKGLKPKDEDERDLVALGASAANLAWRRWAIPNLCGGDLDMFRQEYPSTDIEAFQVTGVTAFSEKSLKQIYEPIQGERGRLERDPTKVGATRFVSDPAGKLVIYKRPSQDPNYGKYFIGADPCFGSVTGDLAVAQVINRHTKEQVAVWEGSINPILFGDELAKIGSYYNMATISPEVEGGGLATVTRLASIYPHIWHHRLADRYPGQDRSVSLGWSSTWKRKHWMIAKLSEVVETQGILVHDKRTFEQMRTFTYYGTKGWGDVFGPASRDQHDDHVSALAIAMVCDATDDQEDPLETLPPERDDGSGLQFPEPVVAGVPYRHTSEDDMGDAWEEW